MKKYIFLLLIAECAFFSAFPQLPVNVSNASVRLFNPTGAGMLTVVEVPTGSLSAPGLIDWNNVHLESEGKLIPFAVREGKAHWKSGLKGSIKQPLPEDLLVFPHQVAPGDWSAIKIVNGRRPSASAMVRRRGMISVSYPGLNVHIDERTGMLTTVVAHGDSLLQGPLRSGFFAVGEGVIEQHGSMNPGNSLPSLSLKKGKPLETTSVQLVSSMSNQALTELNFVLRHKNEIAVGLTYRIYPSGQLEIISDERPWKDRSPWLSFGLEYHLPINGEKKELDEFQTYFPYYGFKEYAASVKSTGDRYQAPRSVTYVFGEESINGRFWKRKLACFPADAAGNGNGIVDLLSEGLAVKPEPVRLGPLPFTLQVLYDQGNAEIGRMLVEGLVQSGVNATGSTQSASGNMRTGGVSGKSFSIILDAPAPGTAGISGDGFIITSSGNSIHLKAHTQFGLYKAVTDFLRLIEKVENGIRAPLIASNPVVDLRAGGFGGGTFEVDFPYGDEAEWKKAIDGMMMSGMNAMTDLGMWSNWKMPVKFKYMPELMSTDPNAYDEVSGARFSSIDSSREFAMKLLDYIHARGGKVWLWVPVGAIPTTFEEKFPEATVPGKSKVPRFTHPAYRRYLESYFKELLETYPVDGFVLIRDDNGGIDDTEEFKQYLANTKTKDRVWEQYVVLHKLIRDLSFKGTIAVYPYFDLYKPNIEELIPKDIVIVGHGSGIGPLTRDYETLGTMGDTWLDNLFVGFRIPSSQKMKRLLSDRGSYWIGGAYTAMELSWEAVGYFGWEPTASVNSFRYEFGARTFGEPNAPEFISFSEASDNLWEIMNGWLFPPRWFSLTKARQGEVTREAGQWLEKYRQHLEALRQKTSGGDLERWIAQADLYATYFNYHLERANLSAQLENLALVNLNYCAMGSDLPQETRQEIISINDRIYKLAGEYERQMAETPGDMLAATRAHNLTKPYLEFVNGYSSIGTSAPAKTGQLFSIKQFDAIIQSDTSTFTPGEPFEVRLELRNTGFMPWIKEHGFQVKPRSGAEKFSIKEISGFVEQPVVFGDTLTLVLRGIAPKGHGSEEVRLGLFPLSRHGRQTIAEHSILLKW